MAALLIEVASLLGKVHSFAAGDVLEIDDGVGDAALRPDDQPLKISGLF